VELFGNRTTGEEVAVKSHGIFERSLMINWVEASIYCWIERQLPSRSRWRCEDHHWVCWRGSLKSVLGSSRAPRWWTGSRKANTISGLVLGMIYM
jgi:hypothetical protein